MKGSMNNNRGVALIIVLLVTALLIALIFEFAYGTRVSLRAAVNFRNSQRAYYLARSGVNFVGRFLAANLKSGMTGTASPYDNLEQREWQTVPFLPGNDAELRVKWDDEAGKIKISDVTNSNITKSMIQTLFEKKGIDRVVFDRLTDPASEIQKLSLLTGLHQYMSDEEFNKVHECLTVSPVTREKININTASQDILQSLGINLDAAGLIVVERNRNSFKDHAVVQNYSGIRDVLIAGSQAANFLTETSNVFKVYSYATVGGYTKQVEAVITRSSSGFTVNYWRAL